MCLEDADGSVVLDYSSLVSDWLSFFLCRKVQYQAEVTRTNPVKDYIPRVVLRLWKESIRKTQH